MDRKLFLTIVLTTLVGTVACGGSTPIEKGSASRDAQATQTPPVTSNGKPVLGKSPSPSPSSTPLAQQSPIPSQTPTPTPLLLPGDGNYDGCVDAGDYTLWADHFGEAVSGPSYGDFNSDGVVDAADYTLWADHEGEGCN